jgi:Glycosyltransferase
MKILLINLFHYRRGGSEVVYFNTADLLRSHGHEVIFFSQRWPENVSCPQSIYFCKGIDANSPKLSDKIKGVVNYFYNGYAAKNLERLIKQERPDVAHIHLSWGALAPSILPVLKKYNIPIVDSVHEYRMVCPAYTFKNGKGQVCEDCYPGHYLNCIIKRCSKGNIIFSCIMTMEMYFRNVFFHPVKYIDAFIYVSKFCRDVHLKHDTQFKNCYYEALYNFRNFDVVEYRDSRISTYNNYYLYYGRLSFEKGLSTLIEAFSKLDNQQLKIVGTGPLKEEIEKKCNESHLNNIEFCGYKAGAELYDLVKRAKFVIVPSEWYENNPMTIVEAYSLRTPVIGAAIGGITEIIRDNVTGYLFVSGSIESLTDALNKSLCLGEDEYKKMKDNAERFSDDNFDSEVHYQKLIAIYKKVTNNVE